MDRAFKGVWIPAEIWLNENLTVMEKVLYAEIDSFCGNGKECFCSNAHFAKLLQVSERQVQRLLVSLEAKGIITKRIVYKDGRKEVDRRYLKPTHVTTPPDKIVMTPPDESVTPSGDEYVVGTNPSVTNPINIYMRENAKVQKDAEYEQLFSIFYKAYPKKKDKVKAFNAFKKLKPDQALLDEILKALEWQKQQEDWQKDKGQYVPYPATYLNGRRWEDEPQGVDSPKTPPVLNPIDNKRREQEEADKLAWIEQQVELQRLAREKG